MNIKDILSKLKITKTGYYDNHFYIIDLADSTEYAKYYSLLSEVAVNTEYPNFETNTNKSTIKIINYFETEFENQKYNIFLIADFNNDHYYIKIGDGNGI